MGERDDVDIFRLVAGFGQQFTQVARARASSYRAEARVKQDELVARVDDGQREGVLERLGGDKVRGSERFDFGSFLVHAERRLEVVESEGAIENGGDLESTELKAVDFGAEYAKHSCNQDKILSLNRPVRRVMCSTSIATA